MIRLKKVFAVLLAVVVMVVTCPVWIVKGYYELSCYVLENLKIGLRGK